MVVIEGMYDADDVSFDGDEVPVEVYFKVGTKDSSTQYDMTFVKAVYKNTKGANATTVAATTSGLVTPASAGGIRLLDNADGMVIGSSWAEGTLAPTGWKDELYDREGYCQIFKTAIETFSGTSLATEYRGIPNEFRRVWTEKLMEHKMDLERAMLFGVGIASESGTPERHTWGIILKLMVRTMLLTIQLMGMTSSLILQKTYSIQNQVTLDLSLCLLLEKLSPG